MDYYSKIKSQFISNEIYKMLRIIIKIEMI